MQIKRSTRDHPAAVRGPASRRPDLGSLRVPQFLPLYSSPGELLHLAVHDLGPAQPRPGPADPEGVGGRGLLVVAQVAKTWGVHRDPEGGTVVWCALQTAQQRQQP
jgi:hypothetical protein